MSVNDYWVAKMQATEASGEKDNPETTMEEDVSNDEKYQEGSQGTTNRINRTTGEVEEVPADPATTPAPGVVDENPPDEAGYDRTKWEASQRDRKTVESVRGSEVPLVDENYRPVANPDTHAGPVFEYSPTVSDTAATTDDDEISAEENVPAETKTDEERAAEVAGTTRENAVTADLEREGRRRDADGTVDETGQTSVAPGTAVSGTFEGTTDNTYEQDKARATEKVPTSANTKQEIKDYLIYQHGVDPDDLENQTKSELLELVDDLAE